MEAIKRHIEPLINEALKHYKGLYISGARKCGKDLMLINMYPSFSYLDLEDYMTLDSIKKNGLPSGDIILGSAQRAPFIIKMLVERFKDNNSGKVILTSFLPFNAFKELKIIENDIAYFSIMGLSLREILNEDFNLEFIPTEEYINSKEELEIKRAEDLWYYIQRGAYLALLDSKHNYIRFYNKYIKDYLENDIKKSLGIKNIDKFKEFMTLIALKSGDILSYSELSGYSLLSEDKCREWINILKETGIINLLESVDKNDTDKRIFFTDTGLLSYLYGALSPRELKNGELHSNAYKTFIINEIAKSYINKGIEYKDKLYYYKNELGEIDLVIDDNNILYPIIIDNMDINLDILNGLDKIKGRIRGSGAIITQNGNKAKINPRLLVIPDYYI